MCYTMPCTYFTVRVQEVVTNSAAQARQGVEARLSTCFQGVVDTGHVSGVCTPPRGDNHALQSHASYISPFDTTLVNKACRTWFRYTADGALSASCKLSSCPRYWDTSEELRNR